jgi:hypothetical protein
MLTEGVCMKRCASRGVAGLALATVLVVLSPGVAFASDHRGSSGNSDATTTTTENTSSNDTTPTTEPAPPTTDRKTWHEEMVTYHAARLAINQAFKSAVSSAQAIYQSARTQATSAAARSTARAAYVLALTQAFASRDSALIALGRPPSLSHSPSSQR